MKLEILLICLGPIICSAQTWETLTIDDHVTVQVPGEAKKTGVGTKLAFVVTQPYYDIIIERSTIADSLYQMYGGGENFEFYYKGFVSALTGATQLEILEPDGRLIGNIPIRTFVTPRQGGLIQWGLFMVNRDSYMLRFVQKGAVDSKAERARLFKSITIKE